MWQGSNRRGRIAREMDYSHDSSRGQPAELDSKGGKAELTGTPGMRAQLEGRQRLELVGNPDIWAELEGRQRLKLVGNSDI